MSPVPPTLLATRRSLAVGVWSLLVALMALVTSEVPPAMTIGLVLLVSIASFAAWLLVGGSRPVEQQSSQWQQSVSAAIAIIIPLGWSVLLGWRGSAMTVSAIVVVTLILVIAVCILLMSGDASFAAENQLVTTAKPIASPSDNVSSRVEVCHSETAPSSLSLSEDNDAEEDEFNISESEAEFDQEEQEETVSSNVTQWLTRSKTEAGEIIEGGVRIDFITGQRDATVHVSFCPPLHSIPEVTTEDLDGADLEIRVAATFPFGARLHVRRPATTLSEAVETCRVGFVAIATPVRRAA